MSTVTLKTPSQLLSSPQLSMSCDGRIDPRHTTEPALQTSAPLRHGCVTPGGGGGGTSQSALGVPGGSGAGTVHTLSFGLSGERDKQTFAVPWFAHSASVVQASGALGSVPSIAPSQLLSRPSHASGCGPTCAGANRRAALTAGDAGTAVAERAAAARAFVDRRVVVGAVAVVVLAVTDFGRLARFEHLRAGRRVALGGRRIVGARASQHLMAPLMHLVTPWCAAAPHSPSRIAEACLADARILGHEVGIGEIDLAVAVVVDGVADFSVPSGHSGTRNRSRRCCRCRSSP